jgi:hypothetical protein
MAVDYADTNLAGNKNKGENKLQPAQPLCFIKFSGYVSFNYRRLSKVICFPEFRYPDNNRERFFSFLCLSLLKRNSFYAYFKCIK